MGLFSTVCESRAKVGTFFVLRPWDRSGALQRLRGCDHRVRPLILVYGFASPGRLREAVHQPVRRQGLQWLPRSGEALDAEGIVRW